MAGGVVSDTNVINVAVPRLLDRRQINHEPVIPRADNLHRAALAGGDLDAHKSGFFEFPYMHGYRTVGQAECFRQIIHAEGVVFVDHFHNFYAHRGAQCLKHILGFSNGTKI